MKRILVIASAVLLLGACATAPRLGHVIPKEGGVYEVIASGETADDALGSALHTAETTCSKQRLRHIVLEQRREYRGVLPEASRPVLKKADEIVIAAGGQPLPSMTSEDDYRLSLNFRCER